MAGHTEVSGIMGLDPKVASNMKSKDWVSMSKQTIDMHGIQGKFQGNVLALLATTFPRAYELTTHINPRLEHVVRLGGIIRMVARATSLPPTRHGWHHGARQGCEESA